MRARAAAAAVAIASLACAAPKTWSDATLYALAPWDDQFVVGETVGFEAALSVVGDDVDPTIHWSIDGNDLGTGVYVEWVAEGVGPHAVHVEAVIQDQVLPIDWTIWVRDVAPDDVTVYGTADGVVEAWIPALWPDDDAVWAATWGGIVRADDAGVRTWTELEGVSDSDVRAVARVGDVLWVGYSGARGIAGETFAIEAGELASIGPIDVDAAQIDAITVDEDGRVWLATPLGLYVVADRVYGPVVAVGLADQALGFDVADDGRVWVAHVDGVSAWSFADDPVVEAVVPGLSPAAVRADGDTVIVSGADGVVVIDAIDLTTAVVVDGQALPDAWWADRVDGRLIASDWYGVYDVTDGVVVEIGSAWMPGPTVRSLLPAADGGAWLGTDDGLVRMPAGWTAR